MSEGECKQRGEQRGVPQPASHSHEHCSCCGHSQGEPRHGQKVFLVGASLAAVCQQQASKTVAFLPGSGNPAGLLKIWLTDRHRTPSFFRQKMAVHKKRCLKFVVFLLPVVLGSDIGICSRNKDAEEFAHLFDRAHPKAAASAGGGGSAGGGDKQFEEGNPAFWRLGCAEALRKQCLGVMERQGLNQAALELASEIYIGRSDWALKTSGATTDMQRTLRTYDCKENWVCRVLWLFRTPNPPDTILQPDVSPENCWPLQGQQGQVVIRLPAQVHLAAVSVQHIYKEVCPSGTITSAPETSLSFPAVPLQNTSWGLEVPSLSRLILGVNADREEETLLGMFVYNVEKEAIQTFPLKVRSMHEGKMPRRKPGVPASLCLVCADREAGEVLLGVRQLV
ncbi:uncharacterized protein AAGF69_016420 [Amazona ochrocephala]